MKVYLNGLDEFKPWAGAVKVWEAIQEAGLVNDFELMLEDNFPDGLSITELNDILWHDKDFALELVGLVYCNECGNIKPGKAESEICNDCKEENDHDYDCGDCLYEQFAIHAHPCNSCVDYDKWAANVEETA